MRITDEELARRYNSALDNEDWDLAAALQELIDHRDESGDYHPETNEWELVTDPHNWGADRERMAQVMDFVAQELNMQWHVREGGDPAAFIPGITRDPLTPDTRALAAQWAAHPPPAPEHWQPGVRLCPYRTGQKILGADIIIDPTLPRNSFKLNGRTFTFEPHPEHTTQEDQ